MRRDPAFSAFCAELVKLGEREDPLFTPTVVGGTAALALLHRGPQQAANILSNLGLHAVARSEGALSLKDRIRESIRNRILIRPTRGGSQVTYHVNRKDHGALPGTEKLYLNRKAGRSTLEHELGHVRDKNIRAPLSRSSHVNTYRTLRNELVANTSAIRRRGVKQVPHALASYGTYVSKAAYDHPVLAALAAGSITTAAARRLLDEKKTK